MNGEGGGRRAAEIRRPKTENRRKSENRNPKAEDAFPRVACSLGLEGATPLPRATPPSDFGLRISALRFPRPLSRLVGWARLQPLTEVGLGLLRRGRQQVQQRGQPGFSAGLRLVLDFLKLRGEPDQP